VRLDPLAPIADDEDEVPDPVLDQGLDADSRSGRFPTGSLTFGTTP